ncbi:MAG: SusC/RagA family TonB-linked outer membrane protein [Bacteroidales bacterium]|nr:SusC/RagA family TonB-linked outer membrane protein [Bacteroidales bacterium]
MKIIKTILSAILAAASIFYAVLSINTVYAQSKITVQGKIVDSDGGPLPGVAVVLEGTNQGVVSDNNGVYSFTFTGSDNSVLIFKFIGMKSQKVTIGTKRLINVILELDTEVLEEVIVTGYGNITKEAYTGSASVITSSKIENRAIGTFEGALRGLSPGTIVAGSGQPGEENTVRLRGIGSLNAGNQPLYVIDGVVWDQVSMTGSDETTSNPLNALNPSDIATITILKDAASASLYGSRGANGVIVITTKQGRSNENLNFSLNIQSGVSWMNANAELVDGQEYAELWTEGKMNSFIYKQIGIDNSSYSTNQKYAELVSELKKMYQDKVGYTYKGKNYSEWMKLARQAFNATFAMPTSDGRYRNYDYFDADRDKLPNTDWFKEVTRIAPFSKINASLQGGNSALRYFSSMEYYDQQGTMINSELKRYAYRVKMSQDDTKKLFNWGTNLYLSHTLQTGPIMGVGTTNYFATPTYAALLLPSVVPSYLEDGSYNFSFPNNVLSSTHNPVANSYESVNRRGQTSISPQAWIQLNLTDWLKFKSTNSMYYVGLRRRQYYSKEFGSGIKSDGYLTERDAHRTKITSTNMLFFSKKVRSHSFDVTLGAELEDVNYNYVETIGTGFIDDSLPYLSNASSLDGYSGSGYDYSLFSLVSKADYSYKNKYLLSGSFRQDRSSRFAPEHRVGNFWSVSGAYRLSNERFMRGIKWLSNLKLKASYGINGTLPTNYYHWQNLFQSTVYNNAPGAISTYISQYGLSWESNRIWNVGVEFGFLRDKIRATVEYYNRKSKDMLMDLPISYTSGYTSMLVNTDAGIHNRGFEIDINANIFETRDIAWDVNLNMATLDARYYGLTSQTLDQYSRQLMANGERVYSWYLMEYGGIDTETGRPLYVAYDDEGNKYLSTSSADTDYSLTHSGLPKLTGGFSTSLTYKNWDFSMLCSFAAGFYIYDRMSGITSTDGYFDYYSIDKSQLDRWTPENVNATSPVRVNNASYSTRLTRFLYKGDYLNIKNVKVQYTIPDKLLSTLKISRASIFAQAENPLIITELSNYDPEMTINGYRQTSSYPTSVTITAGVVINF